MLSPSVPYVVSGVHWIVCGKHCCGQYYWDVPGYDWIHWNVKYCSMWKSYIAHFTRVRESLADGLIFRCSSVPADLLDWKICARRSWPIGSWSCRLSRGATWDERILKNSRWTCFWTLLDSNYQSLDLVLFATCECGIVMSSVVSVCVSVCTIQALSFEGLYLGISFSLWRYILRISRPSSYVKVIGSSHRSKKSVHMSCWALTFKYLDLQTLFLVHRYIFIISWSCLSIRVIELRSRSYTCRQIHTCVWSAFDWKTVLLIC